MTRVFYTLLLLAAALSLVAFTTRVQSVHYVPFTFGAALGWLSQDDGRSHPMKGAFTVNKFGYNADVDTTEETIWDVNDLGGPARCNTINTDTMTLYISSDDAGDADKEITVEGIATDGSAQSVTLDLGSNGIDFVQLGTASSWRFINRAYSTEEDLDGNVYIHLDTGDGNNDGVPDSPSTELVAAITAGENQTLQACYFVPLSFDALMLDWCKTNASQAAAGTAVTIRIRKEEDNSSKRTQSYLTLGDETAECAKVSPPVRYPALTVIDATGSNATSQAAAVMFGLVLVPNDS